VYPCPPHDTLIELPKSVLDLSTCQRPVFSLYAVISAWPSPSKSCPGTEVNIGPAQSAPRVVVKLLDEGLNIQLNATGLETERSVVPSPS
jgi:hypothetical protein